MDDLVHPTEEQLTDYDENGVDLTLIRWWQSLTPLQQLKFVDQQNTSIARILERNDRK